MKAARGRATQNFGRGRQKFPRLADFAVQGRKSEKKTPKKSGNSHLNWARLQKNIGF